MSKIEVKKKDVIWSYLSSFINSTINLIALPFILRMLSPSDVGLWSVFLSISSIVLFLDFGFSPTIIRNISYCWCGATDLFVEGLPIIDKNGSTNYSLLKSMLVASKKIYSYIAICALIIMSTFGSMYILSILEQINLKYLFAWFIFVISVSTNLYYMYFNLTLKAIGAISVSNKINILARIVYLIVLTLGLFFGYELLAMSIANLIYTLILGLISKYILNLTLGEKYKESNYDSNYSLKKILYAILPNAKKSGLVSVLTFVIVRFNTLLSASFLGLEITASYSISIQIIEFIGEISRIVFYTFIPKMTSLLVENNKEDVKGVFSFSILFQWIVGIIGLALFFTFGNAMLVLVGSNIKLPISSILLIMSIMFFLGWNHSSFATFITLSNTIPFLKSGIITTLTIMALSIFLIKFTNLGIWALVLPRFLVSLGYDNWKWPHIVCKELNVSFLDIVKIGVNQVKGELKEWI